jgi:hypothetical protein
MGRKVKDLPPATLPGARIRVVQKLPFLNNFRLKAAKMRSILRDLSANRRLADNQPGYSKVWFNTPTNLRFALASAQTM